MIEGYKPPAHPTPPTTNIAEAEIGAEISMGSSTYITISSRYYRLSSPENSSSNLGLGLRIWSYFNLLNI